MTDPALPTDRAPTFAELIASLGEPQSYAEQIIIEKMTTLARDAALYPVLEHTYWTSVYDFCFAVQTFREFSSHPPIANYPGQQEV